ncbi:hypothetical protein N7474_002388 [Penicillium riverlandense]|uniref:uncharacterized protein n=1 Tax=Penicillium riverlandense TaxID=1903569 RepID=UPI0025472AA3|nr:uncharacterized protein N7474_002388 [Penicillium riverlandense]KAJ5825250.1 hypothetical protein N7474_002388 [Penicillium riverlandense]
MAGSIDDYDRSQVDEKATVQPHEGSSDLEPRHSHQEAAEELQLHESERDIPVRYTDYPRRVAMCLTADNR